MKLTLTLTKRGQTLCTQAREVVDSASFAAAPLSGRRRRNRSARWSVGKNNRLEWQRNLNVTQVGTG